MTVHVLPPRAKKDGLPSWDVTTRSAGAYRELSPMLLGPVHLYSGIISRNVENAWQYSKLYEAHATAGVPTREYWDWAMKGWSSIRAERYPMGKGASPLYSLWNGKRLGYIEARKRIYIPMYAAAVRAYRPQLLSYLEMVAQKQDIVLNDFDAYDRHALGYSWEDVVNDPSRKMGHGFVLAMMIEGVL